MKSKDLIGFAYVNGEFIEISKAGIPILDWGFLHSDATYEVAHVYKGRFFRLKDHIKRFYKSIAKLKMSISYKEEEIISILTNCVRLSKLRNAYVSMICTRGIAKLGSRDPRTCKNSFFAFAMPFVWILPKNQHKNGLDISISSKERISKNSVDPKIKNYHWLDMTMALFEAYDKGALNAVLIDRKANVLEGPGFNIFIIKNSKIYTPKKGVFLGTTRKTAIYIAKKLSYEVIEKKIPKKEVYEADEVFISTSAGGIIPITKIDNQIISNKKMGNITKEIRNFYWNLHKDKKYFIKV